MFRAAVRVSSLAISLIFLAGLTCLAYAVSIIHAPGPATDDVTLVLNRGMGLNAIADLLEQNKVIKSALVFGFWVRVTGDTGTLRAGEYRFPARIPGAQVATMLAQGQTLKRSVTVPEGLDVVAVQALISESEGLTGELTSDIGEGTLLPETYVYEWGDTRAELLARMAAAMDQVLAELWPERAPDLAIDTPFEALILASMVEKETGLVEERPLVAGVFLNRLRLGMRLQSDPTVVYGLRLEGEFHAPLTRSDLEADHPFNTYKISGLPVGPIANPGRAAIEAVLHPQETENLYFVANGEGGHVFAVTLDDHNRNVARYRQQ